MKIKLSRGVVGVLDQAVSAGGNLLLLVAVASQVDAAAFGRFALIYAVYVVSLGLSRALNNEPLIVLRSGAAEGHDVPYALAGGLAAGVGASLVCGVGILVAGQGDLYPFVVFLPALLLQDSARMSLLMEGKPSAALGSDSLWTFLLAGLLAVAAVGGAGSLEVYIACWGVTGALAAVFAMWKLSSMPRFAGLPGHFRATRHLSTRYIGEYLSGAGALQLVHFTVAGVLGVSAIGALRAAQTLLGPFNQLLTGLNVGLMPELVRLRRSSPERVARWVISISLAAAAGTAIGVGVLSQLPDSWGEILLGDTWAEAQRLIVPAGAAIVGNMLVIGPLLGLRAHAAARASLRARLWSSVLLVIAALGSLYLGATLIGVTWAIAGAVIAGSALWWWAFWRNDRLSRSSPSIDEPTVGAI